MAEVDERVVFCPMKEKNEGWLYTKSGESGARAREKKAKARKGRACGKIKHFDGIKMSVFLSRYLSSRRGEIAATTSLHVQYISPPSSALPPREEIDKIPFFTNPL